ncbi:hypothetical protein [Rummeliibacillus sp. G93]|nr:hypothetical protein [Rummeliibacillus sp. G93]
MGSIKAYLSSKEASEREELQLSETVICNFFNQIHGANWRRYVC